MTEAFKQAQKEMEQLEKALEKDRKEPNTTPDGNPPFPEDINS